MITKKVFGVMALALTLVLAGVSSASAQTTYTPPSGFAMYGNNGLWYNASTGQYYNAKTAQVSTTQPGSPAMRDSNGAYILPSGFASFGNAGQYYNSTTGIYYDPSTGFYSSMAPVYTGVMSSGSVFTPGVPNTGAGGDASKTLAVLVMSVLAALTGAVVLGKKAVQA